ncbi:unnamed protein product [Rotaria sp. Silwood2]|nr:unnamed protein product [Rotaria sp. Silwood2]CAF3976834.1 unnamed protein product [Rotaria sp. Silwood2]CAF3999691.1 unnamed protein product [Rotaria sp. Silwood2]
MPSVPSTSIATRKRTRSTNISENNHDHQQTASSSTLPTTITTSINTNSSHSTNIVAVNGPPKRQRNNPPPTGPPPPVAPRTSYSFRNRSLTPDPRHLTTRFPSVHPPSSRSSNRQRYNLRPRRPQSQVRLPTVSATQPIIPPRRIRPPIPPINQTIPSSSSSSFTNVNQSSSLTLQSSSLSPPTARPSSILIPPITHPTPPVIQPRQYRLVYISDDDDEPQGTATIVNTTFDLVTEDDDDELIRSHIAARHRLSRSTAGAGFNTRLRTSAVVPSSATSTSSSSSSSSNSSNSTTATINTQDFVSGVAYVRLNRAIEIVIDSIQSLEGAVNSFDQLVFGLIYGRLGTRDESDSIEGMIRLSRILNLSLPSRLSQDEIDALPKIIFVNKPGSTSSILLAEKCPICLTEFDDQETINKLHCTHLFHPQCISTWLSENDSCPTCRRKVMGD